MWDWMPHQMSWGSMGIGMLLFWALIIALIVMAVLNWKRRNDDAPRSPLDILKERYARGEIDKDEFERRRRDILA